MVSNGFDWIRRLRCRFRRSSSGPSTPLAEEKRKFVSVCDFWSLINLCCLFEIISRLLIKSCVFRTVCDSWRFVCDTLGEYTWWIVSTGYTRRTLGSNRRDLKIQASISLTSAVCRFLCLTTRRCPCWWALESSQSWAANSGQPIQWSFKLSHLALEWTISN